VSYAIEDEQENEMRKDRERVKWTFGPLWIIANTLGWGTFIIVSMAAGWIVWEVYDNSYGQLGTRFLHSESIRVVIALVLSSVCWGAIIGVLQQFVLRRHFELEVKKWVLATTFGLTVYRTVQILVPALAANMAFRSYQILPGISTFVSAVAFGIAQWFVLRRYMKRSGWWIAATASALWLSHFAFPTGVFTDFFLAEGLLYGVATWITLAVISRRLLETPPMTRKGILFIVIALVVIVIIYAITVPFAPTKSASTAAEIVAQILRQRGIRQRIIGAVFGDEKNALIKAEYTEGRLTVFWCGNCGIKVLPPEVGQLTQLQSLNLAGNRLSESPPEIGQLTQLQSLNLAGNRLTELPPEIGQLTQLEWLNLNSNRLTELPPEIGQLTQLQSLYFDNNRLTELPPEIGQLTQLQRLHLEINRLAELPPEIGQLTQLQWLRLAGNRLTELPPEIEQMTGVEMEW
jgi:hypothetical protein